MRCQHCKKDVILPFRCNFCKGYFCVEHRLPENHACPEYWRARSPREEPTPIIVEGPRKRTPRESIVPSTPRPAPPRERVFWFSTKELRHLAIGTLLATGVGMSLFRSLFWFTPMAPIEILMSLAAVFTSAFILHELAHKMVAQHYGLWAEFRLTSFGALVTLISILSPIKIISPGAVMIVGYGSRETLGKVSVAGPLTNIVLCLMEAGVALLSSSPLIYWIGGLFNASIALINLIPFGMFDGYKVFRWDKLVWGAAFVLSILLLAWTILRVY